MTQNEIISMAQDSGVWNELGYAKCLTRFAELVAAHEREACAKVCDDKHDYMCSRAAASIRARGEK